MPASNKPVPCEHFHAPAPDVSHTTPSSRLSQLSSRPCPCHNPAAAPRCLCWGCLLEGEEATRGSKVEAARPPRPQQAGGPRDSPSRREEGARRRRAAASPRGRWQGTWFEAAAVEVSPLALPSAHRRKPLGCDGDAAPAPASQKPGSHHYRPSARLGAVAPSAGTRPFFSLESPAFGYLQPFLRERQEAEWIRAIYGYLPRHVLVLWGWGRSEGRCSEASSIPGLGTADPWGRERCGAPQLLSASHGRAVPPQVSHTGGRAGMSSRGHLQRGEVHASSPLISCLHLGCALAQEGGRKCFRVRGLFPRKTKKHIVPQNERTIQKHCVSCQRKHILCSLLLWCRVYPQCEMLVSPAVHPPGKGPLCTKTLKNMWKRWQELLKATAPQWRHKPAEWGLCSSFAWGNQG